MTARLTRAEQRAQTHAELLKTARAEFLRNGYAATSLDRVADVAGYSKGAVYSNFTDKPALCQAVLTDIRDEKFGEVAAITDSSDDLEEIVDAVSDWIRATVGDVEWTSLELEFSALARTDPTVRAMTVESRRQISDAIAGLIEHVFGDPAQIAGDLLPDAHELADLALSTGIGMGISRAFDPTVSLEPGLSALKTMAGLLSAFRGMSDDA
ncbi:MAG: TetR/AcrR family transcriptional regulator [Gemmatales bacterium]